MSDLILPLSPLAVNRLPDWRPHFAEEAPRELQAKVLDWLISNWGKYRNFVLELPTGVGKSAIAQTIARTLYSGGGYCQFNTYTGLPTYQPHHTYITTTSKQLQHQYVDSYGEQGLSLLYSADNFKCNRSVKTPITCGDGSRISEAQQHPCPGVCPYREAKHQFMVSPHGILNLAYFINETYYAHQLPRRGLLIMDEGHTVGEAVASFISLDITDKALASYLLLGQLPKVDSEGSFDVEELKEWIENRYLAKVQNYQSELANKIDQWLGSYEDSRFLDLSKEHTEVDKHACRVRRIIKELNPDSWVAERTEDGIKMSPIRPTPFMREVVTDLSDHNIVMSATILDDKFLMKEYDLDPAETLSFSAPSPFPKENRPIYFTPVGKIDHNRMEYTMRPFADMVKVLLEGHAEERGIIFVSSYAQVKELIRQVGNRRLITHEGSAGKNLMMERHRQVKNSVIVSPSMHEGVDLKGDLSRFQVILKMPFPSLGSKVIKLRSEVEPEWYAYTTCLDLIQATGRSVRSDTDHAVTYILDQSFGWYSSKWSRFFPPYWVEALSLA